MEASLQQCLNMHFLVLTEESEFKFGQESALACDAAVFNKAFYPVCNKGDVNIIYSDSNNSITVALYYMTTASTQNGLSISILAHELV